MQSNDTQSFTNGVIIAFCLMTLWHYIPKMLELLETISDNLEILANAAT